MRNLPRVFALLVGTRFAEGGQIPPPPVDRRLIALSEAAGYIPDRTEARALCRQLGLDVDNEHWDQAGIADFIRLAFDAGTKANQSRLASPDMADAIYTALKTPAAVLPREPSHEDIEHWTVRAIQQAVAYGVPKEST